MLALVKEMIVSCFLQALRYSRTFLWMVKVLRDFRRRRISPANKQRRAAERGGRQALIKRSSSARQALAMFPER
eukprot:10737768-Heterocapsa_arctica.AAC.1